MRTVLRTTGAAATLAIALAGVSACSSDTSDKANASSNTSTFQCPSGGINFGVEPYEDSSKLIPAYKAVSSALQKSLNCKVNIQITESYAAEILAMQNGKLQVGEFGPLGYVFASQNADAIPVASFANANGTLSTYTAGIWVKKGSPIQSVKDLRGKSLALSSAGSTSGDAYPRYAILSSGMAANDVKTTYAGGHPQSLLALTNGKVDAAEINSQEEATAIAAKSFDPSQYREIWKSQPIANDPIAVWGKSSPAFRAAVTKALLNLDPSTLQEIGKYLDVEPAGPLLPVTKTTYQQLFDLAATLHLTTKDLS